MFGTTTMNLAHSRCKSGASRSTTNISVRFVLNEPLDLKINHVMKTSLQENPIHPALFRIAAMIGNPVTPVNGTSASSDLKKEFEAFRREIAKSKTTTDTLKSQTEIPPRETCGWSFPFPIRK
jgi:hypothetical protein